MYGSEEDEFSSMSMGSDDLEAFGMMPSSSDDDDNYSYHGQDDEYYSIQDRYRYGEFYEMSSDELSVEDGEHFVDDFGIELEEDEPMSYEDFQDQYAQKNDDDDCMEEADSIQDQQEDEQEYYSSDSDSLGSGLKSLSYFDQIAFGIFDYCDCEYCIDAMETVVSDIILVKSNSPTLTELHLRPNYTQHFTDEGWGLLGRYIGKNNHLRYVDFSGVTLTEEIICILSWEMMGRNKSIVDIDFSNTSLGVNEIQALHPFLTAYHFNFKVKSLRFDGNTMIQDGGFEDIGWMLASSPIQDLFLNGCGIKDFAISDSFFPRHLKQLSLCYNRIDSVGCRALALLLQRKDSTLNTLRLRANCIDDDGASIIATSLRMNKSLSTLDLHDNKISEIGHTSFFLLVNNMSSICATRTSNHTLENVNFGFSYYLEEDEYESDDISSIVVDACLYSLPAKFMKEALSINSKSSSPEEAGRKKVINTQLNIIHRDVCSRLQGVKNNVSLFSDIDCPLHLLPEILALIGENHGLSEMFVAVNTSISTLTSLSMRKVERLKIWRHNLSLDMKDAAGELKTLLLADSFSREDHYRMENLKHEMGCIFQDLVELDREISSYSHEGRA